MASTGAPTAPVASGKIVVETAFGSIHLIVQNDAAPITAAYIASEVSEGLYDGGRSSYYRSDFVIQCGLHQAVCPRPNLTI